MNPIFKFASKIFDPIEHFWENEITLRKVSTLLVFIFIFALLGIELNKFGILPQFLAKHTPNNSYMAINIAFTLVLIMEVVSLILTLPDSMSKSIGKQFEILALIFIRNSFKELSYLPEPIVIDESHLTILWSILSSGTGAICIFALLGVYSKLLIKYDEAPSTDLALCNFVGAKKLVSLFLLLLFCSMGVYNIWLSISGQKSFYFFRSFYTVLIFSDILLVLISQCFLPEFKAIFRNAGYSLATLLIRLALAAPAFYNVLIGVCSAIFAVVLTLIHNKFYSSPKKLQ